MATIKIRRDKGWADSLRNCKIFLDGKQAGLVKQGEEIKLEIEQGNHEIFGKIDWCITKKIKFEIKHNEEKKFEIFSNLRGINVLLSTVYSIVSIVVPNTWIKIKEI